MSQITAAMVKELRERTGAPMMKCKKFLQEAEGDMDAAITAMRKADPKAADKRADKVAAEGIIRVAVSEDGKKAWIAEINCETDFVARDENFTQYADQLMQRIVAEGVTDAEAAMAVAYAAGEDKTFEQARQELVAKIGENVKLRRLDVLQSEGLVGSYLHGDRIGVVAAVNPANADVAKDIAMHVAACNPNVVSGDDMPQEVLKAERDIYVAQAAESGKPAEIVEKMVEGRVKKFLKENSLLGQPFVKDPNQSVEAMLKANGDTKVTGFVRYEVGEGIEKKADNFAEEVMAQAGK
ncbi:MAG: translation elongation factor Ts [Coxiellaceae bacterium]|nr:translation elongation factor Ts [Coxiellaceae bacterium]